METREMARQLALGRVAVGVGAVVAPGLTLRSFFGRDVARPGVKVLARAFGVRDALLGVGQLQAIDRDDRVKDWLVAGLLADGTDLAAALLARNALPKGRVALLTLTAGGATAIGAVLASRWA